MASSPPLLVAAIDFGTTYSGFAFSFHTDFQASPVQVYGQGTATGGVQVSKVPTSVLFTPDQQFHSFGAEAEREYARLCDEDRKEAARWYYFERFKMKLYKNPTLSRDTMLMDQTQKKGMLATEVFSSALRYLKDQFTAALEKQKTKVKETDIKWVLTIPAIWEEKARQFMREAGAKAGIAGDQLTLALEPEAASVFCLHHYRSQTGLLSLRQPRKRFLIVDSGGGTIDISVFETDGNGRLKHLHMPKGTDAGGTMVDKAFQAFLGDLLGFQGITAFEAMEMLQLRCAFEEAKHHGASSDKIAIEIPESVEMAFSTYASQSEKYSKKVSVVRNKLMLDKDIFLSFFQKPAESITKSIDEVLKNEAVGRVDAILLAGGFSESDIIQTAVREAFPRDLVLVAPSPSAIVLTGAVMYGHNPDVITARVSAFTYGIEVRGLFREGVHDEKKSYIDEDGEKRCRDVFDVFMKAGDLVPVHPVLPPKTYCPPCSSSTSVSISIYKTSSKNPTYVTEAGCEQIGSFKVLMPDLTGGRQRQIKVTVEVGGTELKVMAEDRNTGQEFTASCDFLSKYEDDR